MRVIVEPEHVRAERAYPIVNPPPSIFALHRQRALVDQHEELMHAEGNHAHANDRAGNDRFAAQDACQGGFRAGVTMPRIVQPSPLRAYAA